MRTVKETLELIVQGRAPFPKAGICCNVRRCSDHLEYEDRIYALMRAWPEGTGLSSTLPN